MTLAGLTGSLTGLTRLTGSLRLARERRPTAGTGCRSAADRRPGRSLRHGTALGAALGDGADGTVTELFWSALHGMSLLERAGRMREEHRPHRIAELAARFAH